MRILITGGCGFQGSHLAESYAKDGHDVVALNTPSDHAIINYERYLKGYENIQVVWGSVNDRELVERCMRDVDLVYHLAAKINVDESIIKPFDYARTNLVGTSSVLGSVEGTDRRMVHASTCEVYGANLFGDVAVLEAVRAAGANVQYVSSAAVYGENSAQPRHLMNEWHPLCPQSPYAASKAAGDRMVYAYIKTHNIKATIVRPFNIYGPRQKCKGFGAVIPIFFDRAVKGLPLVVNGDGTQTRDFLHVADLVRGYRTIAAQENGPAVVNLGSGAEVQVRWLAERIIAIVGRGTVEHREARAGEVQSFIADNSLVSGMGFTPSISIDVGLSMYWQWHQDEYL